MTNCNQQLRLDALRQEHDQLIQLYVHEDLMAWQLNAGFLAMNAAFIAASYGLGVFDAAKEPALIALVVLVGAALLNWVAFFTFERSKIHRNARLNRIYQVEDELRTLGFPIQTLGSAERNIEKGVTITDEPGQERSLKWYEKREALRLRRWAALLPALWLGLAVWVAVR